MIVRYGNVGIGTTNPTQKLDVAGYVKGTGLCIGNDCRTSWPGGSGVPRLSQKYVAQAGPGCGIRACTATTNMGTHSFCALVGQDWQVYDNRSSHAHDYWKCLVNYSNGSWFLTAYYYGGGDSSANWVYTRCEAMCIDF